MRCSVMIPGLRSVRSGEDTEVIRGYEGEAAARYFRAFLDLVPSPPFQFAERSRRPPLDPMNALLSFLYAMLQRLRKVKRFRLILAQRSEIAKTAGAGGLIFLSLHDPDMVPFVEGPRCAVSIWRASTLFISERREGLCASA